MRSLEEFEQALEHGAEAVLLDNMTPEQVRQAVERVASLDRKVPLEAFGRITTSENIRAYAETGVDFISVGALTHSVPAVDLSMRIAAGVMEATDSRSAASIVRLLSDNATVVISGTRIAEELGTSRSEVWRAVQHLRELGVQIAGHPATGYQLEAVPDFCFPTFSARWCRDKPSPPAFITTSASARPTSRPCRPRAAGEPEGAVFVAEQQTAGRGRGGHTWDSAAVGGHLLLGRVASRHCLRPTRCSSR